MKYKAILRTYRELPRPVQIFGDNPVHIFRWATDILAGQSDPNATVEIYKLQEVLMKVVKCDPGKPPTGALESREGKVGPKGTV